MPLPQWEIAYTAGLFDGEGTIRVRKVRDKSMVSPAYGLLVYIGNTNIGCLEWLKESFGGEIEPIKLPEEKRGVWKVCYRWSLISNRASEFLTLILPYLKIKKQQAQLGVDFQRAMRGKLLVYGMRLPRFEVEKREWFYQQLKQLNRRGSNLSGAVNPIQDLDFCESAQIPLPIGEESGEAGKDQRGSRWASTDY